MTQSVTFVTFADGAYPGNHRVRFLVQRSSNSCPAVKTVVPSGYCGLTQSSDTFGTAVPCANTCERYRDVINSERNMVSIIIVIVINERRFSRA